MKQIYGLMCTVMANLSFNLSSCFNCDAFPSPFPPLGDKTPKLLAS